MTGFKLHFIATRSGGIHCGVALECSGLDLCSELLFEFIEFVFRTGSFATFVFWPMTMIREKAQLLA
jgi:hypothetical protein